MTPVKVFRLALWRDRPRLEKTVLQPPSPQQGLAAVEIVEFGLPTPLDLTAWNRLWQEADQPPFDLILDCRQEASPMPLLPEPEASRYLRLPLAATVWELAQRLQHLCSLDQIQANIIDTAADAIITINEDHQIIGFNQGAEKIFGYSREEALGQDLSIIIPPPHKERHREYVQRYLADRTPRFIGKHVQLKAQRRNGEEFPMSISFSVAVINDRFYFTGIVRDITEYVRIEERLRQNERLAAIGNTVSHIVHEIKNPLMIIGGFAQQLLRSQTLDDKGRQKLAIIAEEVNRLEALVAEMRDYSRPPALKKEVGNLADLLNEVDELCREMLREKNIVLKIEIQGELQPCQLDFPQLKQVLLNLIRNAAEAIQDGGEIVITVRRVPPNLEIAVSDTGIGMPPEVMSHIFTPYYTTKTKGSGLGLAISRNIIQAHNGTIEVASTPGKGSTFTIKLPLAEIEAGTCPV